MELIQAITVCQNYSFDRFKTNVSAYLDVSQTSTDEATLTFTLGDATLNQWKIKVRIIRKIIFENNYE